MAGAHTTVIETILWFVDFDSLVPEESVLALDNPIKIANTPDGNDESTAGRVSQQETGETGCVKSVDAAGYWVAGQDRQRRQWRIQQRSDR